MLKKQFLKSRPVCKVTFSLPKEAFQEASEVRLLGDFNQWSWEEGFVMKKGESEYKVVIELPKGLSFQFRYVSDEGTWENDWHADAYQYSPFSGVDNSVVNLQKEHSSAAPSSKKTRAHGKLKPKVHHSVGTNRNSIDDLTRIEGIGPKIAALLHHASIPSFASLCETPIKDLRQILDGAGLRYKVHDPTSWPKQAATLLESDLHAKKSNQKSFPKKRKG